MAFTILKMDVLTSEQSRLYGALLEYKHVIQRPIPPGAVITRRDNFKKL